ncbi:MAG: multicopper oxidase family protein [Planctomycetaceae bacterium]
MPRPVSKSRRHLLRQSASVALVATAAVAIAQDPKTRTGGPSIPKTGPKGPTIPKPGAGPITPRPVNPTPTPKPPVAGGDTVVGTFRYTPFTVPLPIPQILDPVGVGTAPYKPGDCFHGIAPEYFDRRSAEPDALSWFQTGPEKYYEVRMKQSVQEIIPGVQTPIYGYDGLYPGRTIRSRVGQPIVVRFWNDTPIETSIHMHGGHTPSHSDGSPHFYVLPGRARDYYYPMSVPNINGQPDFSESPSTMWFHDHAMDITSHNVWRGMCGFCLLTDDLEEGLVASNVLPGDPYDIPLCLQDRKLNPDGSLAFNPLDFNGTLGNIWVANGKAQPVMKVERRKYRFRILNGCNARFMELQLSSGQPFLRVGKDTWLYPRAIQQQTLMLSMAQRADVVIDFTDAPNEVFLENILSQDSGRGPNGAFARRVHQAPMRHLKFVVEGPPQPNSATVDVGTTLRPHEVINPAESVVTRTFDFHRRNGAWQINNQFFDPTIANATPTLGSVEKWILRNNSGGWWHPIHVHLESHQLLSFNGGPPPTEYSWKNDTTILDGGGVVELLMRFRTFKGPFVFHCHNVEHEDMRMMFNFDPRTAPTQSPTLVQASYP